MAQPVPAQIVLAGADRSAGRIPVFAIAVTLVVVINLLALENAAYLTPGKLALVPANPYPWGPARMAGAIRDEERRSAQYSLNPSRSAAGLGKCTPELQPGRMP